MRALWWGATALAFVSAVSLSPAMAGGAKTSGGNTWPDVSQRVDRGTSTVAASPAMLGPRVNGRNIAPGILDLPADPGAAAVIPHYEWQYHYVGRHAHWEGQWVLVM
jgi:hypothetical protein